MEGSKSREGRKGMKDRKGSKSYSFFFPSLGKVELPLSHATAFSFVWHGASENKVFDTELFI